MFAIRRRSDSCWYVGAADKKPVYSADPKTKNMAKYRSIVEAQQRVNGLGEDNHEIVPVSDA